jgi:probable rRNA maturation factor
MVIKFIFNGISVKIPERKRLKQFIIDLFEKEGKKIDSLIYIFCLDKYLLSINIEFLGHNEYTDIISFSLSDPLDPIVGEIYISAERVKENAKQLGIEVKEELFRVIFHGALHLCGYKDKTKDDKKFMTAAEDKYLKIYFS